MLSGGVVVTSFMAWALSLMQPPSPPVAPVIPQGMAWCGNRKLCDTYREFDVLPGHPASKMYGAIPSLAFCVHCGEQMDVDLPEPEEAA